MPVVSFQRAGRLAGRGSGGAFGRAGTCTIRLSERIRRHVSGRGIGADNPRGISSGSGRDSCDRHGDCSRRGRIVREYRSGRRSLGTSRSRGVARRIRCGELRSAAGRGGAILGIVRSSHRVAAGSQICSRCVLRRLRGICAGFGIRDGSAFALCGLTRSARLIGGGGIFRPVHIIGFGGFRSSGNSGRSDSHPAVIPGFTQLPLIVGAINPHEERYAGTEDAKPEPKGSNALHDMYPDQNNRLHPGESGKKDAAGTVVARRRLIQKDRSLPVSGTGSDPETAPIAARRQTLPRSQGPVAKPSITAKSGFVAAKASTQQGHAARKQRAEHDE